MWLLHVQQKGASEFTRLLSSTLLLIALYHWAVWGIQNAHPCLFIWRCSGVLLQSAVKHLALQDMEHAQHSWHLPADLARSAAQ